MTGCSLLPMACAPPALCCTAGPQVFDRPGPCAQPGTYGHCCGGGGQCYGPLRLSGQALHQGCTCGTGGICWGNQHVASPREEPAGNAGEWSRWCVLCAGACHQLRCCAAQQLPTLGSTHMLSSLLPQLRNCSAADCLLLLFQVRSSTASLAVSLLGDAYGLGAIMAAGVRVLELRARLRSRRRRRTSIPVQCGSAVPSRWVQHCYSCSYLCLIIA